MSKWTAAALGCLVFICSAFSAAAVRVSAAESINAYYFYGPGCRHCAEAEKVVAKRLRADPQVALTTVDIHTPEGFAIGLALLTVAGVGPDALPSAPGLLVGDTYVSMGRFTEQAVATAVEAHRLVRAPDIYERAQRIVGQAQLALPSRFRRWGVLTVLGAGLLDGINPCAFATLVFFVSYLAAAGMTGRRLVVVGLLFAAGVFAAYFAFGLGILHALLALQGFPLVRRALYGVIAAACLACAGVSVRDYARMRAGNVSAATLQLPRAFKRHVHHLIREGVRARFIVPGALLAGAGVSAMELACTGQVYVPAIIYMSSISETSHIAMAWLSVYCLCFVTPLLALVGLLTLGASSKRVALIASRQAASTKLYLAVFFVLCGLYFGTRAIGG